MPADPDLSAVAALVAGEGQLATGIAEELARCGFRVILATPGAASAAAAVAPAVAPAVECITLDGQDEAQWQPIAHRLGSGPQRFGIMVNAALADARCAMQDMKLEQFRAHHRRVMHATFLGVRFAASAMRAHGGGGSIINVIGLDWRMPAAGASAQASSGGGVRLLTKAAALELGPDGIRVNTIQCDLTGTPPRATVQDVARAAVFLASGRSRFMTGADLLIDGGRLAGA